jgi:hypothetical protein
MKSSIAFGTVRSHDGPNLLLKVLYNPNSVLL